MDAYLERHSLPRLSPRRMIGLPKASEFGVATSSILHGGYLIMATTKTARLAILSVFAVAIPALLHAGELRIWTDSTGKLKVEAELISANQETVVLKRVSDGKQSILPLSRLSEEDQAYIRAFNKKQSEDDAFWPAELNVSGTDWKDLPEETEVVEVISDSAEIKIANDVIATVKKGERFVALGREGHWMAISFATQKGQRQGWIFASQVKYAAKPGITQDSKAPGPYEVVKIDFDKTQFSARPTPSLMFELTITNRGLKSTAYDVANLVLQVDEGSFRPGLNRGIMAALPYSERGPTRITEAQFLSQGEVAPGETVTGWVRFELPRMMNLNAPLPKKWILTLELDDRKVERDFLEIEFDQVGKTRSAKLISSIKVLELGSRINLINVGKLIELLGELRSKNEPYIIVMPNAEFFVDELAGQRLMNQRARPQQGPPIAMVVGENNVQRQIAQVLAVGGMAPSESAAAIMLAANQQGPVTDLIKHLSNPTPTLRLTTVQALTNRIREPEVVEAFLEAIDDDDSNVRAALARALGSGQDAERISERLTPLLDDSDSRVITAAATSLGRLKSKQAVPRLTELAADSKHPAASYSVDALKMIGELSELDAALRKLDLGRPSSDDFAVLAKTDDKEVVQKLIQLLEKTTSGYQLDPIALTLGKIGDTAAVDPLLRVLANSRRRSPGVVVALGKLGDKRAIGPIQGALKATRREDGFGYLSDVRSAALEALLMLDAPNALEQVIQEIKQIRYEREAMPLLNLLGRTGGDKAVESLATFLDHSKYAANATTILLGNSSDEAFEEIKKTSDG